MGATLQVLKLSCNRKSLNANKFWFWSTSILEIMATKYVDTYKSQTGSCKPITCANILEHFISLYKIKTTDCLFLMRF